MIIHYHTGSDEHSVFIIVTLFHLDVIIEFVLRGNVCVVAIILRTIRFTARHCVMVIISMIVVLFNRMFGLLDLPFVVLIVTRIIFLYDMGCEHSRSFTILWAITWVMSHFSTIVTSDAHYVHFLGVTARRCCLGMIMFMIMRL